jgi:predicted anti-sigma-YlaC factor YlaD
MSCATWRDAISGIADGEPSGLDARLVDAHVARCEACAAFREDVHRLARSGISASPDMPDLSRAVVRAARLADRLSVRWVLRAGLVVVAVQVAALGTPALLLGDSDGAGEHAARHLGSFAVAYAIGLVVVALRPAKARGMLPMAAALAGCLVVTAVIDVARGESPIIAEVTHVPELVGLVLVWLLAAEPRRHPASSPGSGHPGPDRARPDRARPDRARPDRAGHPGSDGPGPALRSVLSADQENDEGRDIEQSSRRPGGARADRGNARRPTDDCAQPTLKPAVKLTSSNSP